MSPSLDSENVTTKAVDNNFSDIFLESSISSLPTIHLHRSKDLEIHDLLKLLTDYTQPYRIDQLNSSITTEPMVVCRTLCYVS